MIQLLNRLTSEEISNLQEGVRVSCGDQTALILNREGNRLNVVYNNLGQHVINSFDLRGDELILNPVGYFLVLDENKNREYGEMLR